MPDFRDALKRKRRNSKYIKRKPTKKRTPQKINKPKRTKSRSKSRSKGKTVLQRMLEKEEKEKKKKNWVNNWDVNSMLDMEDSPRNNNIQKPLEIPSGPPWKYAIPVTGPFPPKAKDIEIKPPAHWIRSSPKDLSVKLDSPIYDELTDEDYKDIADKTVDAFLGKARGPTKKKKRKNKSKKKRKNKSKKKKMKGGA